MLPAADKAALRREGSAAGAEAEAAGGGEPPTGGVQTDIVVLGGWPATADPPKGPVTHWVSPEGVHRAVRIRIEELACTSDLQSGKKVNRKRAKYRLLVLALRAAGWNVVDTVHVVTVGVRRDSSTGEQGR
eukprot:8713900-Pyramimonas_sp.AAC.1